MRLTMMGTGPFAVPTFRALLASRHDVTALVTRPVRATHRRRRPDTPMLDEARSHGVPVEMPEDVNEPQARATLAALDSELLIVCDYGQILSPDTLAVARRGGLNLHASLLPKYRGAAPVAWAVWHGETETGITVIAMSPRLDAGPAIAQLRVPIDPEETAGELEGRLADLGAPLICQAIDDLETGAVHPVPQDPTSVTRAPRLKKTDGLIDWCRGAPQLKNQVRALQPWPTAYTFWQRAGRQPLRLILREVTVDRWIALEGVPAGTVQVGDRRLWVATGEEGLEVIRLQPAGKRAFTAAEFLLGYDLQSGDRFGTDPDDQTSVS
ncbi:MAG: methionyl-tRNA formyltransferase [Pirellulales bacterium]